MAFRYHDLLVNLAGEGGEQDKGAGTACCPNSPCGQGSIPPDCKPKSHHPKDDDDKKREERKLADLGWLQGQLRQALDSAGA
jgi:hypothetical protein